MSAAASADEPDDTTPPRERADGRNSERGAADTPDDTGSSKPRQRVERAPGGRRARLTPAPGSDPEPEAAVPGAHEPDAHEPDTGPRPAAAAPDDDRITRERPPHW